MIDLATHPPSPPPAVKGHGSLKALSIVALLVVSVVSMGSTLYMAKNPTVFTLTQNQYLTELSTSTIPPSTETTTETRSVTSSLPVTVFQISRTTTTQGGQTIYIQSATSSCGYPFDPSTCNEGSPITVVGNLAGGQSTCVFMLGGGDGRTYALYNLQTGTTGFVQVFGYAYPNWPQGQQFPPYQPFPSGSICSGIPFWVLQGPQTYSG